MRLGNGTFGPKSSRKTRTLRMPAGGQRLMADFAPDGWGICGGDQYAPSIWNPSTERWMAAAVAGVTIPNAQAGESGGTWAVAVSPTDSNCMTFVAVSGAWTTTNARAVNADGTSAATFTRRIAITDGTIAAQDGRKFTLSSRAAYDPANPNVIAWALPVLGLMVTTDGGATVSRNANVPICDSTFANGGSAGVIFDPHSAVVGTGAAARTQGLYYFATGFGLYRLSAGAAGTGTRILTDSTILDMAVQPTTGRLLVCGSITDSTVNGATIRYCEAGGTTFTNSNVAAVKLACHPTLNRVFATTMGGGLMASTDGGATFGGESPFTRSAPLSPWQAWTNEGYMTCGCIRWNAGRNALWLFEGIGAWEAQANTPVDGSAITWTAYSRGIEDMVGVDIVRNAANGIVDLSLHDRVGFTYTPDKLGGAGDWWPGTHAPGNAAAAIRHSNNTSRALDNPNAGYKVVRTIPYKVLNGVWTPMLPSTDLINPDSPPVGQLADKPFPSQAPNHGEIVCSNEDNLLWIPHNGKPTYLKNGVWGVCKFLLPSQDGGTPGSAIDAAMGYRDPSGAPIYLLGLRHAYWQSKITVIADYANPGTFYVKWADGGNAQVPAHRTNTTGIWKSTDGGVTFSKVFDGVLNTIYINGDYYYPHFKQVQGFPTHFFFASCSRDSPACYTYLSTDSCATWTQVAGIQDVRGIGFSTNLPGRAYPRIVVSQSNTGLQECLNFDPASPGTPKTWTQCGEAYPGGMFGDISSIADDFFAPFGSVPFSAGPTGGYLQEYDYVMRGTG